ncbi:MAG TPA: di-heme-cytochrome C peroxidase, partial [Methylocystis sp.]|nr:di-heme-cytochrome C peroxidase [Methylocystis sp.]
AHKEIVEENMRCGRGSHVLTVAVAGLTLFASAQLSRAAEKVDQGPNWTAAAQKDFYARDQGSRLIPWAWISALKQANGKPFMAESLDRYGYLPNPESSPRGLPVGWVVISQDGADMLGLTCAACHTRQIEVRGKTYRIDGGPAIADLGSFWRDLDMAVGKVLSDDATFEDFAGAVLGGGKTPEKEKALREQVQAWQKREHAIADRGLPKDRLWGPGRIDAVGMILNRLAGLDIGPPPTFLIEDNLRTADAPVRPPFLWNAALQDKTQWPGFSDNGDWLLGLARNLGEVYGVFGIVHPQKDPSHLLGFDLNKDSTAQYEGLLALERDIQLIGPPKWPRDWPLDPALAKAGEAIFNRPTANGGCVECHGIRPGAKRMFNSDTWATPLQDVGTDSREYRGLARPAKTGALEGAWIPDTAPPYHTPPLKPVDAAVRVLSVAGKGAVWQHFVPIFVTPQKREEIDKLLTQSDGPPPQIAEGTRMIEALKGAFPAEGTAEAASAPAPEFKYESRVLQGIWAAAPYLHNASVPTLAELLKPAAERVKAFKVGPRYDIDNVGLAVDQTKFDFTLQTTDCSARDSGDSRCGHPFGTTLSPDEKKALLEYLKTL